MAGYCDIWAVPAVLSLLRTSCSSGDLCWFTSLTIPPIVRQEEGEESFRCEKNDITPFDTFERKVFPFVIIKLIKLPFRFETKKKDQCVIGSNAKIGFRLASFYFELFKSYRATRILKFNSKFDETIRTDARYVGAHSNRHIPTPIYKSIVRVYTWIVEETTWRAGEFIRISNFSCTRIVSPACNGVPRHLGNSRIPSCARHPRSSSAPPPNVDNIPHRRNPCSTLTAYIYVSILSNKFPTDTPLRLIGVKQCSTWNIRVYTRVCTCSTVLVHISPRPPTYSPRPVFFLPFSRGEWEFRLGRTRNARDRREFN